MNKFDSFKKIQRVGLVNTDNDAFVAYKKRREILDEKERRINKLENDVIELKRIVSGLSNGLS